jgi:hypothetical protein
MRFFPTLITAVAGLVAASATASAAPQAMMLVAGGDTLQFRCSGEQCIAEATSICLQYQRSTPRAGTPYELVDEERYGTGRQNGLQLVGYAPSGEEKAMPLETVQIVAEREHMAVRFIVEKAALQQKGIDRLELRVAHNVVVAPVWRPGDADPLTDGELEMVIGPIRAVAENILRQQPDRVMSARLLGDMLNDMPRDRVASLEERDHIYREVVAARSRQAGGPLSGDTLATAQAALDACSFIQDEEMWYQAFQTRISRYRACIGYRHDKLIKEVNEAHWEAMQAPGS